MALPSLTPYPAPLQAALGNELGSVAALGHEAFADQFGSKKVLMAGRFPEGILYTWAPAEIVNYGVCQASLVRCTPAEVLEEGSFADESDLLEDKEDGSVVAFEDRETVIVCAPPLDGAHAFILADMAWREARALETAVAGLKALSIVASWTPERAHLAVAEAIQQLNCAAATWWSASKEVTVAHPRANWRLYSGNPDESFDDILTRAIQRYAREPTRVVTRLLPPTDSRKAEGLAQIIKMAAIHDDWRLASSALQALLYHPETIRGAFQPNLYEDLEPEFLISAEVDEAGEKALFRLYQEELYSVDPSREKGADEVTIDFESPFVIPLAGAGAFVRNVLGKADVLASPEEAAQNLDTYLGGYLADLDLSRSFITGSAAMSSVLYPAFRPLFASHADYLKSYYPPRYTAAADRRALNNHISQRRWLAGEPTPYTIEDAPPPEGRDGTWKRICWGHGRDFEFEVVSGADVDIVVDAEGDEFDSIARRHHAAVRTKYPDAGLVRTDREKTHMYRITSEAEGFREVEIYPATWRMICTHHVAMVRLAYTGATPQFYLTASCLKSAVERGTPNYYYFASRKTSPQEIMLKYAARGFPPLNLPGALDRGVLRYARESTNRWKPAKSWWECYNWDYYRKNPPAVNCIGNYNLEALHTEIQAFGYEASNSDD